jgi:hypothetical protein
MATGHLSKRPATTLRSQNIIAMIWHNVREKRLLFSTNSSRSFKDQSSNWRNGTAFQLNGLDAHIAIFPCQICYPNQSKAERLGPNKPNSKYIYPYAIGGDAELRSLAYRFDRFPVNLFQF